MNVMIEQSLQRHNQNKGKAEDEIESFKNSVEDEKQIQQLDERYAILLTDVADSILWFASDLHCRFNHEARKGMGLEPSIMVVESYVIGHENIILI